MNIVEHLKPNSSKEQRLSNSLRIHYPELYELGTIYESIIVYFEKKLAMTITFGINL